MAPSRRARPAGKAIPPRVFISGGVHDPMAEERGRNWQDLSFRYLKNIIRARSLTTLVPDLFRDRGRPTSYPCSETYDDDWDTGLMPEGRTAVDARPTDAEEN
jgi:hypothetical protein